MKLLLISLLAIASLNAFALTEAEFNACPDYIKAEVQASLKLIKEFDDKNIASEALIDVLDLSVFGRVEQSPTCQEVEHMSNDIKDVIKEISAKKK